MAVQSRLTPGMSLAAVLEHDLAGQTAADDLHATLSALATAGAQISRRIRAYDAMHAAAAGSSSNADGDVQTGLDVACNDIVVRALDAQPVACFASEEEDAVVGLAPGGTLAVAVDPLDGSSNIAANITIGTIFSIFDAVPGHATASFLRQGREQRAAGFLAYGPLTALVLTAGRGAHVLVLDEARGDFRLAIACCTIPHATTEFAINASNYRHWHAPVRTFVDDCVAGAEGPRAKNFNMRWVASLVAETYRIISRGGVFLYPDDQRKGYERGRLRHVYEAAPIAFVIEQAGGRATDGMTAILDRVPASLHERTPLIFGSAGKVEIIEAYYRQPNLARDLSPLFRHRGLFTS